MPLLEDLQEDKLVRAVLVADSGAGKTGSLGALANAGYTLVIADFDGGTQILRDPQITTAEARKRIYVERFEDKKKHVGGKLVTDGMPTAYQRFLMKTENWPGLGPLSKLDEKYVLVIDSGTFLGDCIFRQVLYTAGKLAEVEQMDRYRHPRDYGFAADYMEMLFDNIKSSAYKCHIILTFHLRMIGGEKMDLDSTPEERKKKEKEKQAATDNKLAAIAAAGGGNVVVPNVAPETPPLKLYPSAPGTKLPMKMNRFFNTVVSIQPSQDGKRYFRTRSFGGLDLKVTMPSLIPDFIPINEGWLKIFDAMTKAG